MRTRSIFLAAFVGLILWVYSEHLFQREDQLSRRVSGLEFRMIRAEQDKIILEDSICHEVNIRNIRPSADLSHEQCIKFLAEISRDAARSRGSGPELTDMLTPTPALCGALDQVCQIRRWGRSMFGQQEGGP